MGFQGLPAPVSVTCRSPCNLRPFSVASEHDVSRNLQNKCKYAEDNSALTVQCPSMW